MKICVLNESFLTDEHKKRLEGLGSCTFYADTNSTAQAIERAKDAEIVVADMFCWKIDSSFFTVLPKLRLLCVNSTGYDRVDMAAGQKNNTKVANCAGYSTDAVAEFTLALIFALARKIIPAAQDYQKNNFEIDPFNLQHSKYEGFNLRGKTLGILGMGTIGQRVAQLGLAVGMKVIAWSRTPRKIAGVEMADQDEVFKKADIVTLHLALTPETRHIVNARSLGLMKPRSLLINTARTDHVNPEAVYSALAGKKLGGIASDLPLKTSKNDSFSEFENCIITPHAAWFTEESLVNMAEIIVQNIEKFAAGKPQNIVN